MINKRDIIMLRTPEDLERKYDLKSIFSLKENYELQKNGLNKVENELNNFVIETTTNLKELQDQVDGNITTWFYSGVPKVDNEPEVKWTTDEEKSSHLGDLYYDKDTGYAYRYSFDNNVYTWTKITDTDVTKALAIANNAKDTADSKRRVFVVEPTPPYDCGDLWIKDEELYRCQTTKAETETFEENDWIIATKYTDDTKANQVGERLTILSGTVTEIKNGVDELTTTMTNTTELVNEQGDKIGILEKKQSSTSQTVDQITSTVSGLSNKTTMLEQSIPKYQTELDIYNITIPVDSTRKPIENKDYLIGYKTTFENNEVESLVSSQSSCTGITFGLSNNKITLSVLTSTTITNLTNEFVIDFSYSKESTTYTDSKKIIVSLSLKGENGTKGDKGDTGSPGKDGTNGTNGKDGKDGTSYYVYIRYSSNSNGNPMTEAPTSSSKYMGIASSTSSTAPTSYSSYKWSLIKGANGTNGVNGKDGTNGTNGKNSYFHIKYSNDGVNFTANDGNDVGRYIGSYTDFNETASTNFSDYSWQDTAIVVDEELNDLQNQINDTNKDLNNNYTNNTELNQKLEEQKTTIMTTVNTTITQTKENWQADVVKYINENGVEKFVNTLVTIDADGLKLSKSDEDIVSLLNNKGLYVSDGKLREDLANLLMKVDRSGALFKSLEILGTIKEQEIIQKEKITDEKFGECQAWYWIGSD